jgi:hypothetical protein
MGVANQGLHTTHQRIGSITDFAPGASGSGVFGGRTHQDNRVWINVLPIQESDHPAVVVESYEFHSEHPLVERLLDRQARGNCAVEAGSEG